MQKRQDVNFGPVNFIQTPFLQHFSAHFGYYCLRVALPELPTAPSEPPPA